MARSKNAGDSSEKNPEDQGPGVGWAETILDSIADGVFSVDSEWRITSFNSAAERTLGLKRDEVLHRPCRDVLRSDICENACALKYTIRTGIPVVNLPIHVSDARGVQVLVTISTAAIKDTRGRVIGGVETLRDLSQVRAYLQAEETCSGHKEIITADPRVQRLLEIIPTIAQSDSTILVEGESGTGKGLLIRAIHRASARRDRPMVTINCGALPDALLESELFGYKAGAFTGAVRNKPGRVEAANGGTLFLDEIGDLPLLLQVKLLHLLQDRSYVPLGAVRSRKADVRIVAATNRDLAKLVEQGAFRRDLFYRINVIRLEIPPLRERMHDVPLLARAFLQRMSMTRGRIVQSLDRPALDRLTSYDYPGNVRELENIIEHAYVMCTGATVGEHDLPDWFLVKAPPASGCGDAMTDELKRTEARFLREVLARNGWNRQAAARELGIHKTTLHRKIRRLGMDLPPVDGRSARRKKRL